MQLKILKNKKADISITLLVLGILAICSMAVISFIVSKGVENNNFLQIEVFEEIYSDIEKFYFFKNLEFENEEAVEMVNQYIINTALPDRDKLNLSESGKQLIIERGNSKILVKYTKTID